MKFLIVIKKILPRLVGVILIIGGIFGLFLPVIQGIALIIIGLSFLGFPLIKRKVSQTRSYLRRRKNLKREDH